MMPNVRAQIETSAFAFSGGLDLTTPALQKPDGSLISCQNYEPDLHGGYRRSGTYERFDGRPRPSQATYYSLACTLTDTISAGATVTVGAATGTFVRTIPNGILLANPSGTFPANTAIMVSAVQRGTSAANPASSYGELIAENAQARSDAADTIRAAITEVPGSGPVRGVFMLGATVYAVRDNVGATAGVLHASSGSGWSAVALGSRVPFAARSGTVTITIASPGVVTFNNHGLANGNAVTLSTTGALPTGLTAGTIYYVVGSTTNTFNLAATVGGTAINTSGTQSGTHTLTAQSATPADGETVTGVTSGASGIARRVALTSGSFLNAPVGILSFTSITGTFSAGECLSFSGGARLNAVSAQVANALPAGGTYRFADYNFGGRTAARAIYGANGVGDPFEFDGTTFTPITGHGMPSGVFASYVAAQRRYLFLGFGGSLINSTVANPFRYVGAEGAGEIAVGDAITNLVPLPGEALGVFTRNSSHALTGALPANWSLAIIAADSGAVARTVQVVGQTYALDDRGIVSVEASQNYGNFAFSTVSRKIQPQVDAIRNIAVDSCVVRQRNLLRIFCSDGVVLSMLPGEQPAFGRLQLAITPNVVWSGEDNTGVERIFVGAANGFVYEMDVGSSQDGTAVEAFARVAYNHLGGPRVRKRFRKIALDLSVDTYAEFSLTGELSFGDVDTPAISGISVTGAGSGGVWNISNWDRFFWNSKDVDQPEFSLTGSGTNLGIIVYSNTKLDTGHVLQSAVLHYTPRRLVR